MSDRTVLSGKRVLVTGGAGFLGREVCSRLEDQGAEPVVLRSAQVDLTRQADTEEYLADLRPDIVIHLAAEVGGIGANRDNPGRYFYANATMGIHLIEAARVVGVEKFVQIGTVCAYPKFTPIPFREETIWDGYPEETNAPYGVAKKSLLVMLEAYRQQYGFNGIYLLPVNLYGPGDNFDLHSSHVIPALIRKFTAAVDGVDGAAADVVEVWGTGAASREFLHVADAARGILMGTVGYGDTDPVNLGSAHEITIKDLVELIARLTGFQGEIRWDSSKPDGQPRRKLDTERAKERFGFESAIGFEEGLGETIAWWRSNRDRVHAQERG
ncbi:NAD-dependent epimerase/dehydratase [Euzebya pacifica]|uniref:GDP-L-fucose synthase n=1 Tax=Euzebya pacifica TaxID=1608957 RepID=A0A346XTB6_9ACTN|nr:GDP-L-fucose synthase [Euzebya pacifica]AXV05463.1 NAD-dependent epimerase/dehydratase [Euzebya pacifica]